MGEPIGGIAGLDRSPADARYASLAQPHCAAGDDSEPGDAAVLLRLVERELQAEADTEDRAVRGVPFAEDVGRVAEPVHRRARRADTREDGEIRAGEVVGELGAEP